MKPVTLRTKLTGAFLAIALFSLALVGILANLFLGKQFERYAVNRLNTDLAATVEQVSALYAHAGHWDTVSLDEAGMNLLTEGLILRIEDNNGAVVWDARVHNNGMCMRILSNMAQNMQSYDANFQGGYEEKSFPAVVDGQSVGTIHIGYYGPYYFSDTELQFLTALNRLLLVAGAVSLAVCFVIGAWLARRFSKPISDVIRAAGHIAGGEYNARLTPSADTAELAELTHSLNSLADSLQEQETLRKRLTADVAHELRTPLTTLQSTVEAMLDGVWEPSEPHLASCREEILRLNKLVDELGALSRYDSESLSLKREPFDLLNLAQATAQNFESAAQNGGVSLHVSGTAAPVLADRDKVGQVLVNLLHNALKFTPAGGSISLEAAAEGTVATLTIRDTGSGISPEDLPHIFERFYRADPSRSRQTGGSGIGLAIALAIARAHGGNITATSQPGEGSTFVLSLPADATDSIE